MVEAQAFTAAAPLLFVELRAPVAELATRASIRDRAPRRVSDASLAIVWRESSTWEPLDEVAPQAHATLRSDRAVEEQIVDLQTLLDRCVEGLATRERGPSA